MGLNSPTSPDALGAYPKSKTYATVGAGISIVADGGGSSRAIRSDTAGLLNVDYGGGVTDLVPFLAGETQKLQAVGVVASGTTAAGKITVLW